MRTNTYVQMQGTFFCNGISRFCVTKQRGSADAITAFQSFRRSHYPPTWKFAERLPPFGKSRFPVMNFLATTDKCDDSGPVFMTIHDSEDHFWFRDMPR